VVICRTAGFFTASTSKIPNERREQRRDAQRSLDEANGLELAGRGAHLGHQQNQNRIKRGQSSNLQDQIRENA
jgi:hypothetical protein